MSGTALHNTKLPLRTWLIAMYLIATSSKGISAMKLAEWLGVSYKTAWHLGYRIRATDKAGVFVAVERGGRVIPQLVPSHTKDALSGTVRASVHGDATLVTDELPAYTAIGREYAAESFNAMLKRGIVGVFHYVSRKHLHRYAAEAAFRWNERAGTVLENLALMVRFSRTPLAYGILVS